MDCIFCNLTEMYYRLCSPYNQAYFDRMKQDDDFKMKHHQEVLSLVEAFPLDVLRSLSEDEVDKLAQKTSELLRASLFAYPLSKEYNQEIRLVGSRIRKSDYPLAARFRKSFEICIKDLHYYNFRDKLQLNSYMLMSLIHMVFK